MLEQRFDVSYTFDFGLGISKNGAAERQVHGVAGEQVSRVAYTLDDVPLVRGVGRHLVDCSSDLIDIAVAVNVADRLSPRSVNQDPRAIDDRWRRRIHLAVPVRLPSIWSSSEVRSLLEELLFFLSDDDWSLEFVSRRLMPRKSEMGRFLLPSGMTMPAIILQSGGLDSLAGLAHLLESNKYDAVVPVTVLGNSRLRTRVRNIEKSLRNATTSSHSAIFPARLKLQLSQTKHMLEMREPSQRLRGFLFIAAGIVAAIAAGAPELNLCENGIGAIGLPMTHDHLGTRATRAMHPRTHHLVSRIASCIIDSNFTVVNVGLEKTKSELVKEQLAGAYAGIVSQTSSCDRASYLNPTVACGKCSSCILRRLSILEFEQSGSHPSQRYMVDFLDPSMPLDEKHTVSLVAMRMQVESLREIVLADSSDFSSFLSEFPAIHDVVSLFIQQGQEPSEVHKWIIRLYRAYLSEFDQFVTHIDHPGWGGKGAEITQLAIPLFEAAG